MMGRGSAGARRRIPARPAAGGLAAGLVAALAGAAAITVLVLDAERPDVVPASVSLPLASGVPAAPAPPAPQEGAEEPDFADSSAPLVPAPPVPQEGAEAPEFADLSAPPVPQEGTEVPELADLSAPPPVLILPDPASGEGSLPGVPPLPLEPGADETLAAAPPLPMPAQRPAPAAPPPPPPPGPTMPSSIFGSDLPSLMEVASAGAGAAPRLARRNVIGWNNIRWGVTEDELKRRFGAILSTYDRENFEAFRADHYLKDVRYFSLGFDVIFQMSKSDGRLAQVLIDRVGEPDPGDFKAIYATMRRIYGEPADRQNYLTDEDSYFGVDSTANTYKKATWRFPTTTIQLTILAGPAFFRETKGWFYLRYYPSPPGPS